MSSAITTLRSTIATALENPGVWSTYSYPPATVIANSVIVAPADGDYIVPANNTNNVAPLANLKIVCTVPAFDNQGNLAGIEDFMVAVFNKIRAITFAVNISSVSSPVVFTGQSGDLLSFTINISTLTTWS
jgi:hypothetical protein